jgi:hypothetical protein
LFTAGIPHHEDKKRIRHKQNQGKMIFKSLINQHNHEERQKGQKAMDEEEIRTPPKDPLKIPKKP